MIKVQTKKGFPVLESYDGYFINNFFTYGIPPLRKKANVILCYCEECYPTVEAKIVNVDFTKWRQTYRKLKCNMCGVRKIGNNVVASNISNTNLDFEHVNISIHRNVHHIDNINVDYKIIKKLRQCQHDNNIKNYIGWMKKWIGTLQYLNPKILMVYGELIFFKPKPLSDRVFLTKCMKTKTNLDNGGKYHQSFSGKKYTCKVNGIKKYSYVESIEFPLKDAIIIVQRNEIIETASLIIDSTWNESEGQLCIIVPPKIFNKDIRTLSQLAKNKKHVTLTLDSLLTQSFKDLDSAQIVFTTLEFLQIAYMTLDSLQHSILPIPLLMWLNDKQWTTVVSMDVKSHKKYDLSKVPMNFVWSVCTPSAAFFSWPLASNPFLYFRNTGQKKKLGVKYDLYDNNAFVRHFTFDTTDTIIDPVVYNEGLLNQILEV